MRSALIPLLPIILGFFAAAAPGLSRADIAAGDRAWAARAEVLVDGRIAAPGRIEGAIGHYREAVETDRLADHARVLFWSAIAWGSRAQRVGLLTIVREGVAGQMHHNAQQSLILDSNVDRGGALRLLSRLQATLPRVPFVSGWVNRDKALPLAERAMSVDPEHPGNRLILALTLLEREPDREQEARRLLERVVASEPRPDFLVGDLAIHEQARERLETLNEDS